MPEEGLTSEKRKYRTFTPEQKLEIVLAGGAATGPGAPGAARETSETLCYSWRDRLLEGGKAALATPRDEAPEDAEPKDLKKRVAHLERALGRKTHEPEVAGERFGAGRERPRVRSPRGGRHRTPPRRRGEGGGHQPAAICRPVSRRPTAAAPGRVGPDDAGSVEVARSPEPRAAGRDDEAVAVVEAAVLARDVRRDSPPSAPTTAASYLPRLPSAPVGPRDHAPPGRASATPRARRSSSRGSAGSRSVVVQPVREALRLAGRVGKPRPGLSRDRRLRRGLPPPAALRARLPHRRRGLPDLRTEAT